MDNLGSNNDLTPNENENYSTAIKSIFVNGYSNASREFEKFCTFWRFTDRPRNNMNSPTLKEGTTNSSRSITFEAMNKDEMNVSQPTTFLSTRPNKNDTYEQTNKNQGTIYERVIPDSHRYQGKQKRSISLLMNQEDIGTDNHPSSSSLINTNIDNYNNGQQHLTKRVKYMYDLNDEPTLDSLINKGKRSLDINNEPNNNNNNSDHSSSQNNKIKKIKVIDLLDDDGNTINSRLLSLTNRKSLSLTTTTTPTTPTPTTIPSTSHMFLNEDTTATTVNSNDNLRKDREEKLLSLSSIYSKASPSLTSSSLSSPHRYSLRTSRLYNFNDEGSTSSTFNLLSLEDERLTKLEEEVHSLQSQINKFADSPFILQPNQDDSPQPSLINKNKELSSIKKNKEKDKLIESPSHLTKSSKFQWPPSSSPVSSIIDSGKRSATAKTITKTKTSSLLSSYDNTQYSLDTSVTSPDSVNIPSKKQQPKQSVLTSTPLIVYNDNKSKLTTFNNNNNNKNTLPPTGTVHIPKTSPKIKQSITNTNTAIPNNINNNNNNTKTNSDKTINNNNINDGDDVEKNKKYSESPPTYRSPNPINFTPSRLPSYYQKTPIALNILSSPPHPPPPPPSSLPTIITTTPSSPSSPLTSSTSSSTKYTSSSMVINRPKLDLNEIKNHRLVQKQSTATSKSTSTSSSLPKSLSIGEKIVSQRKSLETKIPVLSSTPTTSSTRNTLKYNDIEDNHKKFMNKIIQQIPQVNLRKTDMIRGPDGELQQNPIWFEIYKHRR